MIRSKDEVKGPSTKGEKKKHFPRLATEDLDDDEWRGKGALHELSTRDRGEVEHAITVNSSSIEGGDLWEKGKSTSIEDGGKAWSATLEKGRRSRLR